MDNCVLSFVTSSHLCLSASTVSFSISLPLHSLHTHHIFCSGTRQRTWEDFSNGIFMVLGTNVERVFFFKVFFECCEAPSGSDGRPNRWCPGTGQGTNGTMASVPLWASTALQSAVSLWELLISKSGWHFFCIYRTRLV